MVFISVGWLGLVRVLKQIRFVSCQAWKMRNVVVQKGSVETIRRTSLSMGSVCKG